MLHFLPMAAIYGDLKAQTHTPNLIHWTYV